MQGMRVYASPNRHKIAKTGYRLKWMVDYMAEWDELIPRPRSSFMRVKCLKCGNEQVIFSNATNKITCNVCGSELAEPCGGRVRIKGETLTVFE